MLSSVSVCTIFWPSCAQRRSVRRTCRHQDRDLILTRLQSKLLLGDSSGIVRPARGKPSIMDHKPLENYLGRYGGLMLYLKEMDESVYGKLCAVRFRAFAARLALIRRTQAYFSAASNLHMTQIKAFLTICSTMVKRGVDDEGDGMYS